MGDRSNVEKVKWRKREGIGERKEREEQGGETNLGH